MIQSFVLEVSKHLSILSKISCFNMSIVNPENERLRSNIPEALSIEGILEDISQKTDLIHAAFLFNKIGCKLLQKLSRSLCSTKKSLIYSGWRELWMELGLDPLLPNCVEYWNVMNEDPVYIMFITYSQNNDATIGKIYKGLYNIQRHDTINLTKELLDEFYSEICKEFDLSTKTEILKPLYIPKPPLIFQNLDISKEENKIDEIKTETTKDKDNKYDKIVMLTYSSEDNLEAKKVTEILRKGQNGKRIGVIVLNEHSRRIYAEQETLILKFFTKANYIIPIITENYLNAVSEKNPSNNCDNIDGEKVNYIYQLMMQDFVKRGCVNKKMRCIIPDDHFPEVRKHYFFNNPIFRTWFQLSDISKLVEKMLTNRI